MTSNDFLLKGIAAAKEGDKERARTLLSKVVLEMPDSEEAWWWLAQSVDDPSQRDFCAKKILEINPRHKGARAILHGIPDISQAPISPTVVAPEQRTAQTKDSTPSRPKPLHKKKASRQKGARTTRQTVTLVLLAFAVFLVFIGGAAYIFLDTSGSLDQLLNTINPVVSSTTPLPPPAATVTIEGVSLASIPTWTPTPSPLPPPATPSPTPTYTPQPPGSPTPIPPTPSALPPISDAQAVFIDDGTGFLTLFPDTFSVFRFEPREALDLQTIAMLTFHLRSSSPTLPLTVELYLWNLPNNLWEPSGVYWGDTVITNPGFYVHDDGTIIAAIRNWGVDPIDLDNSSFTFGARMTNGIDIIYGLDRADSRLPTTPPPTATAEFG